MIALREAWLEGRGAAVGSPNPYAGDPGYARAWMVGYQTMLAATIAESPARALAGPRRRTP